MNLALGFLGLGNIGSGVYRLLKCNADKLLEREGLTVEVHRCLVRDLSKKRNADIEPSLLTTDPYVILNDPEIDAVVEFMGGIEPARTYILAALRNGKSVITANKMVLSACWDELDAAAREGNAGLYYEASVAGGIPVINVLNHSLQANRITQVLGIVNATTNAILTDMTEKGMNYAAALERAQKNGYAEPDPTMDVSGQDAAHKLSILSSLCFDCRVKAEDIFCRGITEITPEDIIFGRKLGLVPRLLAVGRKDNDGLQLHVHPSFIPESHPLASVRGSFNAIFLEGDAIGQVMLYGRGAGDMPTASAMVSDIVMAAKNQGKHEYPAFMQRHCPPILNKNWISAFYLHLLAEDTPGTLASIAGVLGRHGVSLATVQQAIPEIGDVPIVMITHPAHLYSVEQALKEISQLRAVKTVVNAIPVEQEA
ncbi:MAG: homoserine dehydrogenase [Christensenellales bacterium]|jgi:homoserine dehydrogenase